MLTNKRITLVGETVVGDQKIASYGAVLNIDTGEVAFTTRNIDPEACKEHRDIVRADRAEFEDYVYSIQDSLKAAE